MNRAGLRKVTKTVRGKNGAVKRSYWVKSGKPEVSFGTFVKKHGARAVAAHFTGGAIGGAIDRGYEYNFHKNHTFVGALYGSAISKIASSSGKRGREMRRDVQKMSRGGKVAAAAGLFVAQSIGHLVGRRIHKRFFGDGAVGAVRDHFSKYGVPGYGHRTQKHDNAPPIRVRDVNKGNGYV